MRRELLLVCLAVGACNRGPAPVPADPDPPPVDSVSQPAVTSSAVAKHTTDAGAPALEIGPLDGQPRAARERELLALFSGHRPVARLQVAATEPGQRLDPRLRDELAPRVQPPRIRFGALKVAGRLPPEVIQRILRQRFGQLRSCYLRGLSSNPNLEGRVAVRFVITNDGAVSLASNAGSSLPDRSVVDCILKAVHAMSFPKPEGGIVTVNTTLDLAPATGAL